MSVCTPSCYPASRTAHFFITTFKLATRTVSFTSIYLILSAFDTHANIRHPVWIVKSNRISLGVHWVTLDQSESLLFSFSFSTSAGQWRKYPVLDMGSRYTWCRDGVIFWVTYLFIFVPLLTISWVCNLRLRLEESSGRMYTQDQWGGGLVAWSPVGWTALSNKTVMNQVGLDGPRLAVLLSVSLPLFVLWSGLAWDLVFYKTCWRVVCKGQSGIGTDNVRPHLCSK